MTQHSARFLAGLIFAAGLAPSCTADRAVMQTGLPGARAAASLTPATKRGDYLDVTMESGGFRYRFFLPADDACRAVVGGDAVTYANVGPFGRLQAGDTVCDPIGILSLAAWRDRGPRPRADSVIPRSRAALLERVYADQDLSLVRGRFLLAGAIGFAGSADSIAVIPNVAECRDLEVPGSASMEFRQVGKRPYSLIDRNQLCPVIGFVQVPPNP
jgi:hypothetical protein